MFYFQIVIFESTTVCCPTLKIALTCHSSLNISLNDFNFIRGSSASRASMTSLSPLSESPSTSSLSLSPSVRLVSIDSRTFVHSMRMITVTIKMITSYGHCQRLRVLHGVTTRVCVYAWRNLASGSVETPCDALRFALLTSVQQN